MCTPRTRSVDPADVEVGRMRPWSNPRRVRLRQAVVEIAAELAADPDADPARRLLRRAVEASDAGDVDGGWALVGRIEEAQIVRSDAERVRVRAMSLRTETEVGDKHNAWRRHAILELVAPLTEPAEIGLEHMRLRLAAAVRLHNEGSANEYRSLSLLRRHQRTLVATSTVVLALTIGLLTLHAGSITDVAAITSGWVLLTAVCLGVLGALTSAIQRSTRFRRDRIPRHIETLTASLSRIPLGAVAALTVWLAFHAGSFQGSPVVPALLVAAFGAGFSERLVTQDSPDRDAGPGR